MDLSPLILFFKLLINTFFSFMKVISEKKNVYKLHLTFLHKTFLLYKMDKCIGFTYHTYCIACKNINEKICTPFFSTELLKLDTFKKEKQN